MKKLYISYVTSIFLTLFCMPLSGALAQKNFTITVQPCGGFFDITAENRPQYEKYFNEFGIKLDPSINQVIPVTIQEQHDAKGKAVPINNNLEWVNKTPEILPLDIFTNQKMTQLDGKNNNNIVIYKAFAQKGNFKSHNDLINQPTKTNNNILHQAIQNARQFQQKLTNNPKHSLTFLNKQKNTLDKTLIPCYVKTLIQQPYKTQCAMIETIDTKQHPEILICLKENLNSKTSTTYNKLKHNSLLDDKLINENIFKDAINSFEKSEFMLDNALFIYHIFHEEMFDIDLNECFLSPEINALIKECDNFTKIIKKRHEQQKNDMQNVNTISIPKNMADLCDTIAIMINDLESDKQNDANILWPIPNFIDPLIMKQFYELLDINLIIIEDKKVDAKAKLGKETIEQYEKKLKENITNCNLATLTPLIFTAHYLNLKKEITKDEPVILWSLLHNAFIDKLIKISYEDQIKSIATFDKNLKSDLVVTFLSYTNLATMLTSQYNYLVSKAKSNDPLPNIKAALSIENNKDLTLEKVILINHLIMNDDFPKNLKDITDEIVTSPVDKILNRCIELQLIIEFDEKAKAREEEREKQQKIAEEKKYNSYSAQFARAKDKFNQFMITHKKLMSYLYITFCAALCAYSCSNQLKTLYIKTFKLACALS